MILYSGPLYQWKSQNDNWNCYVMRQWNHENWDKKLQLESGRIIGRESFRDLDAKGKKVRQSTPKLSSCNWYSYCGVRSSQIFANFTWTSLSSIAGSKGTGSRHRSAAATMTYNHNSSGQKFQIIMEVDVSRYAVLDKQMQTTYGSRLKNWERTTQKMNSPISSQFKHQIFKYNPLTSSSKKSTAASSSAAFFREVFRKWKSNWICWNPLRLNVWSRANSCKLFKQSLTIVVITDSCKIKSNDLFVVFSLKMQLTKQPQESPNLCVFNFGKDLHFLLKQFC